MGQILFLLTYDNGHEAVALDFLVFVVLRDLVFIPEAELKSSILFNSILDRQKQFIRKANF